MSPSPDMGGWVGLRAFARERGVDRERLLRHARKLDAGTGRIVMRAAPDESSTGERPGRWLLNVRRLEAAGGPTRAKIDEVVDAIPVQIEDLRADVRSILRRLDALERRDRTEPGRPAATTGRSPR